MTEILIRKAEPDDAAAIAKVHVDSWRTTYSGVVSGRYLESMSYERSENNWKDRLSSQSGRSFTCVAETSRGDLVGFANGGPERDGDETYVGEIYALYLLKSHQRKGIGGTLFHRAGNELRQRSMTSFLVWVLAQNPARKFYEALGGQYLREKKIQIGSQWHSEVAFGWKSLPPFFENSGEHLTEPLAGG